MTTKSCIIVGGGPGGIHVAKTIATSKDAVDVTVIDRQNYMDWSLSSPRMLVQPADIKKMGYVMPLDKVCEFVGKRKDKSNHTKFVQGSVSKISPKSVTLEDGTTMKADVIVIAIGGQYKSNDAMWKPLKDQTTIGKRIQGMTGLRAKAAKAKSILIKGAGPTAVEVAGELKAAFPDTKVTMVGALLPNSPKALQTRMKSALENMGVIIEDGRVDVDEPDSNGKVATRDGTKSFKNIDLVLNCAGFIFAGDKLASDELKVDVTKRGQFNCKPTLQLQSFDSVFACGDVLSVPEGRYADVKGLQHADVTADVVGKNVVSLLSSKKLNDFKWSTKPINKPMMTALGPNVGVGFIGLPNFMENFMARSLKCKDYYMSLKGAEYGKGKTW